MTVLAWGQLPGRRVPLELDGDGAPRHPVLVVDLDADAEPSLVGAAVAAVPVDVLTVGVAHRPVAAHLAPLAEALTLTLTLTDTATPARTHVAVDDVAAALNALTAGVVRAPRAAVTLGGLLRATEKLPVPEALVCESLAYSMLLGGSEFSRWRASTPVRPVVDPGGPAVLLARTDAALDIVLNRPARHNAFGAAVRDGLVEAFDLVRADPTIEQVTLRGAGRSFCSGGDLDEFGTAPDVATAHLIRLDRGVGARVHTCRDRVTARLHGACIGAGIEIPSFAGRVVARPDAFFQLPELTMGLVPGAGGTVGVTRRIGRWRTAWLALTGERIGVDTALEWGLVDDVDRG